MFMQNSCVQFIVIIFIYLLLINLANCADLVVPDYEIKLFADNLQVLEPDTDTLQADVQKFFNIQEQRCISMQFLDSNLQEMYQQGWIMRIRAMENKSKLELSYKYRIPVDTTILATLEKAKDLGWDSSETGYEYQVDWGYEKQTLSINKSKELSQQTPIQLPSPEQARSLSVQFMPGKLEKWGIQYLGTEDWAKNILLSAHIYGIVKGKRYIGVWNTTSYGGIKIYIEVWDIAGKYVTEISCKTKDYQQALWLHTQLKNILTEKSWLLKQDILKTKMILSAYAP